MTAFYPVLLPGSAMHAAGWMAGPLIQEVEDDPVPPQFATRYAKSTLHPPFHYLPGPVAAPLPQYTEVSNYCVAPCCIGYKKAMPFVTPAPMVNNVFAPLQPYVQPVATASHRSSSKDAYKEAFGIFPAVEPGTGQGPHLLTTIPPIWTARDVGTVELDAVDHPSYTRPPHREVRSQKKPQSVAGIVSVSSPEKAPDSGYSSTTASPSAIFNIFQLIPAEPMPAPAPLSIEMSGAQVADAVASVLYDTHAGRFGAIGVPSPPRGGRKASSPALDGALHPTTRGEFVHFVRTVLIGTRVNCAVVASAVSFLCDARLQEELRARSLQLSFVAALSISHKTLDDSPFTTATWAKLANVDLNELRAAERAICYGLSFEVRPELNSERFIDATHLLMSRLSPDSQGRTLLVQMIDGFCLSL